VSPPPRAGKIGGAVAEHIVRRLLADGVDERCDPGEDRRVLDVERQTLCSRGASTRRFTSSSRVGSICASRPSAVGSDDVGRGGQLLAGNAAPLAVSVAEGSAIAGAP
jgi:hypothetical protein